MDDLIHESLSFREGQEKIKHSFNYNYQNLRNNSVVEEAVNMSIVESSFRENQKVGLIDLFELKDQQENTKTHKQDLFNDKNPTNFNSNEIILMKHNSFVCDKSPDIIVEPQQIFSQDIKIQKIDMDLSAQYHNSLINTSKQVSKKYEITPSQISRIPKNNQFNIYSEATPEISKIKKSRELWHQRTNSLPSQKQSQKISKAHELLQTFSYVKKFINKLKQRVKSVVFKSITAFQFSIINDVSSQFEYFIRKKFIQQDQQVHCLFSSTNFQFLFNSQLRKKDLFILVIYIISKYFGNQNYLISYLDYIVYIKYLDIPPKVSEFEIKLQIDDSTKNWMKLIKLEVIVIILAHVACCIFLKMGLTELEEGRENWIHKIGYENYPLEKLYLTSLYFMIVSVCTIGYGDIFPYTLYERSFMIAVALLATNITAYTFSQISEIVKFESSKKQSFNKMMTGINYQLKASGLGMNLQQKVRKFFEFFHYQNQQRQSIQEQLVDKLPKSLKEEVLLELNQEKINSIRILKDLSSEFLKRISLSIRQKQLLPDEILIHENEKNDNLYFIITGHLEILCKVREFKQEYQYEKSAQKLKKKDIFGYEGFLLGQVSPYTIKSVDSSLVSYIEKSSFISILQEFPNDYEKFSFIRDQAIFDQIGGYFKQLSCISCGKTTHHLSKCPFVSLTIAYKPSYQINERNPSFYRKRERFHSLLKQITHLQEKAMAALANNDESVIIDALSVVQKPLNIQVLQGNENDEENDDYDSTSTSLAMIHTQVNNQNLEQKSQEDLGTYQIPYIGGATENMFQNRKSNFKNMITNNIDNDSQRSGKFNKTISFQVEEGQSDTNNIKVNQNTLIYELDKDKLTEQPVKTRDCLKTQITEDSFGNKASSRSIKFPEDLISKDRTTQNDKLNMDKIVAIANFCNTSEKVTTTQSSNYRIHPINASVNMEASQKHFDQPELYLLKQTFEKRKFQAVEDFKKLQRSISERLYIQRKASIGNVQKENMSIEDILIQAQRKKSNSDHSMTKNEKKGYLELIQFLLNLANYDTLKKKSIINEQDQQPQLQLGDERREQPNKLLDTNHINQNNQSHTQSSPCTKVQKEQINNSTEFKIRCSVNLQDLDMLVVRKQLMMMQQSNQIQNFIEVPDNEIDIDSLQNFRYYYHNQNLKYVLHRYRLNQENIFIQNMKRRRFNTQVKKVKKQKRKDFSNFLQLEFKDSIIK